MTLAGRLDVRKGMRENERICEDGATNALIASATLFLHQLFIILRFVTKEIVSFRFSIAWKRYLWQGS